MTKFAFAKGGAADDAFFAALREAGLLVICPNTPDFLSPRVLELKAWIEAGGVVLAGGFTDQGSGAWLKAIGPEYACPEIWGNLGWSTPCQRECDPPDPLRIFPRALAETDQGHHWTNFQRLPAGSPWRIVSTRIATHPEANKHANVIRARVGKGWIILSNIRTPTPDWIENARALAALENLGLTYVSCEGLAVKQGEGHLTLTLTGEGVKAAKRLHLALEIVPRQDADEDQNGKPDAPQEFRTNAKVDAEGNAQFTLDYFNTARGENRVILRIGADDKWATVFEETRQFPHLVEISPPNYRGMVSSARRTENVLLPFVFTPLREKVENARLEAALFPAEAKRAVWQKVFRGAKLKERVLPIEVPRTATGAYRLTVRLMRPNRAKPLYTNEVAFTIRPTAAHQVFVDQDCTLLRGGNAWFPLGIYHAAPNEASEWMKMGFNSQQFWSWDAGSLDALHTDYDLAVIFEGKHNKGAGVVEGNICKYATDPAIAMWYLWDEPTISDLPKVRTMNARMHGDLDRPTFIVCDQVTRGAVRYQSLYGDVVAADSYPLSVGKDGSIRGDVTEVVARIRALREVTGGERPVVAVLQAFGFEPALQFRCMAYLALAEGVNGIYWYCWKQIGGGKLGDGIVNSPELQTVLAQVVKEMKSLMPAFLSDGESFDVPETKVHGRVFGNAKTKRYLLLVNGAGDAAEVKVSNPLLAKRRVGKTVVGDAPVTIKGGTAIATLPAYATVVVELK